MPKKFSKIIAYGCSYTAGDEIQDHKILGMSFEQCNAYKKETKKLVEWLEKDHNGQSIKQLLEKNKSLNMNSSWAAHLSKKLNVEFENRAKGGTAIDEHYYNIVRDLNQGKITDSDLVIVGLTSVDRIFLLNGGTTKTKLLTLDFHWKDLDFRNKLATEIFVDQLLLWNYCKTLRLVAELKKSINIRIQLMNKNFDFFNNNLSDRDAKGVEFFISDTFKMIEDMFLVRDTYLMSRDNSEKCGFGHYSEICHIRLADEIIKKSNIND